MKKSLRGERVNHKEYGHGFVFSGDTHSNILLVEFDSLLNRTGSIVEVNKSDLVPITEQPIKTKPVLKLDDKRRNFLESCGFEQVYKSEAQLSMMGKIWTNMELWEKMMSYGMVKLYIHFSDDKQFENCELYDGGENESSNFSIRNLISEMKKRGFDVENSN